MKKNEILIAGTFNNDLQSGRRMKWLLEEFKPDIIIGETNQLLDAKVLTREMIWAVLFDEYDISVDVQKKWKAIQTHKEHLAVQQYATRNRKLYFMADPHGEISNDEVSLYAQIDLIQELKSELAPEELREHVRQMVERIFDRCQTKQSGNPYCAKFYSDKFMCRRGRVFYADERGVLLAREFEKIMADYKGFKIFGFVDGIHVVNPRSFYATSILGRDFYNLRYHLGEDDIQYGQLVDLIQR